MEWLRNKKIVMTGTLAVITAAVALLLSLASAPTVTTSVAAAFGTTTPFVFAGVSLEASVADTVAERQLGLSGTAMLPKHIAKVFIFDTSDRWGFWMKDMQYPIDIFWLSEEGKVVHIEAHVSPDTYPTTFVPSMPAKYVIETVAGFADDNKVVVGTEVNLAPLIAK